VPVVAFRDDWPGNPIKQAAIKYLILYLYIKKAKAGAHE
jgi:hypothetical protein